MGDAEGAAGNAEPVDPHLDPVAVELGQEGDVGPAAARVAGNVDCGVVPRSGRKSDARSAVGVAVRVLDL